MSRHTIINVKKHSLLEGLFYALMVGIGETYLVAYALHLGVTEREAALLGILPLILGSIAQLFALRLTRLFGSFRKMVVGFASIQALSLAAMGLAQHPAILEFAFEFLFLNATVYWTLALACGPPWNAWISRLIKAGEQRPFFIRRNAYLQMATLLALICAGPLLQHADTLRDSNLFVKLFICAGFFRLLSAFYLSRHPDIEELPERPRPITHFWHWLKKSHVRYSFIYVFLFYGGVHISGPFFTPYMLNELNLGYLNFTVLIATAFAARSISGYIMGALTRNHGVQMMFFAGYLLIIPIPWLWTHFDNFYYLIALQVLSGVAWGASEIGLMLFLMEAMPHEERSKLLSWNNLVASLGMLLGVLIGTYVAGEANPDKESYHQIYTISSIARAVPIFFVAGFITSIRPGNIQMRFLTIRPNGFGFLRPILTKIKRDPIKQNRTKRIK